MHAIAASIPNSVFTNKTTTEDVWDALKALYEGRTTMVLVKTSQQLQTTRCSEDDNLAAMGKSIADSEYASILLEHTCILGPIAAAPEMSGTAVSSAVVVKIATDGYDRRTLESRKTKNEAFTADTQEKKKGHTNAECWAKGGGNEGSGPKRKPKKDSDKSNVATASDQGPDIEARAAIDDDEHDVAIPRVPIVAAQSATGIQSEYMIWGHRGTFPNNKVFHAIGMGPSNKST